MIRSSTSEISTHDLPDTAGYEMDEEAFKRMPSKPWHREFALKADDVLGFI
jgi:hypothetical protein